MRQALVFIACLAATAGCGGSPASHSGDGGELDSGEIDGAVPDVPSHDDGIGKTDGETHEDAMSAFDACVPAADPPDDQIQDTNCDGIDGDANAAVFVATDGHDVAAGTRDDPFKSVNAAVQKAHTDGKSVYVSTGTYAEDLVLADGVSIYGGYDRSAGWQRSAAKVATISGSAKGVRGTGLTQAVRLEYLVLQSGDALTAGDSSYGLFLDNCTGVTLHQVTVHAGMGATGKAFGGPPGCTVASLDGAPGDAGGNVNPGVGGDGGHGGGGAGGPSVGVWIIGPSTPTLTDNTFAVPGGGTGRFGGDPANPLLKGADGFSRNTYTQP